MSAPSEVRLYLHFISEMVRLIGQNNTHVQLLAQAQMSHSRSPKKATYVQHASRQIMMGTVTLDNHMRDGPLLGHVERDEAFTAGCVSSPDNETGWPSS